MEDPRETLNNCRTATASAITSWAISSLHLEEIRRDPEASAEVVVRAAQEYRHLEKEARVCVDKEYEANRQVVLAMRKEAIQAREEG